MTTYYDKPWTKLYDPGVPATLMPYPEFPLYQYLRDAAAAKPNNVAVVMNAHVPVLGRQTQNITYAEIEEYSNAFGAALIDMGLQKGDRVAIVMPNCAQFVIAYYGILKAGGVVVANNPTYPPDKLKEVFIDSGSTTVVTLSLFYKGIKSIQGATGVKNVIVTNIKDYLPPIARLLFTIAKEAKEGHRIERHPVDYDLLELLAKYKGQRPKVEVHKEDNCLFQYTGGTTGVPKAAVAKHSALVANTKQIIGMLGNQLNPNGEVFLAAIPLFHVFGMVAVLNSAVSTGSTMIMVPNPRNTDDVLEVIDHYKPTIFMGVPAMYNAINNHPNVLANKYNLHSIKACVSGSAPLAPITKQKFEQLTGGKLVEGYGMSEAPTAVTVNPLMGQSIEGSIGIPLPDVVIRVVSLDDEQSDVPVGKSGELAVWSPNLMTEYHNMKSETDNVLRLGADGKYWLHTGDIGYMDENGRYFIVDRKKDMLISGGFKIYPANVEKVMLQHPSIFEVGVAAIPHPDPSKVGQEALKAWVVLKPDQKATADELIKFAREKLAHYEVPTRIEFIDELPKTLVGKILRRELVARELEARKKAAGVQA
jgi:long-chain acyl-CoA synthetase